MPSRARCRTVSTAILLIALPVSAAHAQIRTLTPAVPSSPIRVPVLAAGGVGPFGVALTVGSTTTSLGNATTVTFQFPQAANTLYGKAVQTPGNTGTPGSAVVQFAPNNQLAQALGRSCLAQGCVADLVVTYRTPQSTTVYTLQRVKLTQYQLGAVVAATFTYPQYRAQTSTQNQD